MALTTTTIGNDNWDDLKMTRGIFNIRCRGHYPNVHYKCHHNLPSSHYHPNASPFLWNQHKPYGIATVNILDPFDDRPDWHLFRSKPQKRYYEEITPNDREDFERAMCQDHAAHLRHNHVHIKEIQKTNKKDEIADDIIL